MDGRSSRRAMSHGCGQVSQLRLEVLCNLCRAGRQSRRPRITAACVAGTPERSTSRPPSRQGARHDAAAPADDVLTTPQQQPQAQQWMSPPREPAQATATNGGWRRRKRPASPAVTQQPPTPARPAETLHGSPHALRQHSPARPPLRPVAVPAQPAAAMDAAAPAAARAAAQEAPAPAPAAAVPAAVPDPQPAAAAVDVAVQHEPAAPACAAETVAPVGGASAVATPALASGMRPAGGTAKAGPWRTKRRRRLNGILDLWSRKGLHVRS